MAQPSTSNQRWMVDQMVVDEWRPIWADRYSRIIMLADTFDRMAGPYRRTPAEKWVQAECRWRFGYYDPAQSHQATFIDSLLIPASMAA